MPWQRGLKLGFVIALAVAPPACKSSSAGQAPGAPSEPEPMASDAPPATDAPPQNPPNTTTPGAGAAGNEGTATGSDIGLDPTPDPPPDEDGDDEPVDPGPSELALLEATIGELRRAIATRLVTPAQLTEMYLARIAAFDDDGPALNAFIQLNESAIAEATALGARCEDAVALSLCGPGTSR